MGACVLVLILLTSVTDVWSDRFVRRNNWKMTIGIDESGIAQSKIGCLVRCSLSASCRSVSWRQVQHECLLSSYHDAAHVYPFTGDGYEWSTAWETYGKIKYEVALFYGSSGRYTLTYNDALGLCGAHGTTMASVVHLTIAYHNGFERCACGWVSENVALLPLQNVDNNCWTTYPDGNAGLLMCNWHFTTPDVWCVLK